MSRKKVLIVDDEPDLVESIKFRLELEDIECLVANDGQEGLASAKAENPDLILLDVMLPKLTGYKVARLLKFDESYKHIPIIMLTARTAQRNREIGGETGADEYVTKPFEMEKLLSLVNMYLEGK